MDFTLNILPAGGLASSVITTVWVGIIVVVFFNLRFGTTLSGLVVPGYLIPLFIVRPVSGWVILAESVLTYLIARFIADRGLVKIGLGEMFGRDRFLMLILVSVLVRIASDGVMLPLLSEQLAAWGAPYELRSGLHSFGLIIIALCANQFWNGGLKVGASTLALYLLVTYALVSFVLMPLTNFNISTLGYMYEDISSSILASPKAYIILITAAFVASRMNLRYGWDFNGILIPSLLALQWYDPFKILTTFGEALVILFCSVVIMSLKPFRQMNMEGSRQLLLFFNVGFIYKLLLGYAIITWMPGQKVTDYYGFGYVLATLMALKMYQKGIAIRFTRTTLQTSIVAIVLASVMGFSLTLFSGVGQIVAQPQNQIKILQTSKVSLPEFIASSRSLTYKSQSAKRQYILSGFDTSAYMKLFKQAGLLDVNSTENQINEIAYQAQKLGYSANWIEDRYLALVETDPRNGRGFYIIDSQAKNNLTIEVPHALDEPRASAVADRLFSAMGARYLAFSGARARRSDDGSDDVLLNSQTVFQLFHQSLANNSALQLRSYTRRSARQLLGVRQDQQSLDLNVENTSVWVKGKLPEHLSLELLKGLLGSFELNWQTPPTQNRQRDTAINGFVEVYVNDQSLLNIYSKTAVKQSYTLVKEQQRIDGYLQGFLLEDKLSYAAKNSQAYLLADKYQLLYFDQAILQPVLALIDQLAGGRWDDGYQSRLNQISREASQFGYQVMLYRHIPSQAEYIIFKETDNNSRHWGTYVLKLGPSSNYIVEVPMPIIEKNTFEFATSLFQTVDARAILISGTHPLANSDGTSQLTSSTNIDSLFNLFHQSLLQHFSAQSPFAVQIRGFNPTPDEHASQVVVAHFEYRKPSAQSHPGLLSLKQTLQQMGLALRHEDPKKLEQRFQARFNAQSRFTKYINDAQYAEIWLPSLLRHQLDRFQEDDMLTKKMAALNVPILETDIKQWLTIQSYTAPLAAELALFKEQLSHFKRSQNINQLYQLWQDFPFLKVLFDNNSQSYYLAQFDVQQKLQAVANLTPLNDQKQLSVNQHERNKIVASFVDNRLGYLIGGEPQ
jgi:hypothetical protein